MEEKKTKITAIGGSIGVGKSTLVERLSLKAPIIKEFEEDDLLFSTLLSLLYEGVNHSELMLQIYFLFRHWESIDKKVSENIKNGEKEVILDRHLLEHFHFARINMKGTEKFHAMYAPMFNLIMSKQSLMPDEYVLLDCSWESAKDRILNRGRKEEVDNFDKNESYFTSLHTSYIKDMLKICFIWDIEVRVIDTENLTEEEVHEAFISGKGYKGEELIARYFDKKSN